MRNNVFFDLSRPRRIHVIGIGGPGMNAIAQVLCEMGHQVSGSDIHESEVLDRLRALRTLLRLDLGSRHAPRPRAQPPLPAPNPPHPTANQRIRTLSRHIPPVSRHIPTFFYHIPNHK